MIARTESYISDTARRIAIGNTNCFGLVQGKAGQAILLYLSNTELDNKFDEFALNKLNEISDNIVHIDDLRFESGLTGIGWGIEWVAQNNFLDINTDEILEDLDNMIYQSVVYGKEKDESLAEGSLGKLLYFLSRYRSRNPQVNRLKNIFHEECLILLSDDILEKLIGDEGVLSKEMLNKTDLINLGHIVYYFSDFLKENVNTPTAERILYEAIGFIDRYLLKSLVGETDGNCIYKMFLCGCYFLAGNNHKHNHWKNQSKFYLSELAKCSIIESTQDSSLLSIVEILYDKILDISPKLTITEIEDKITISSYAGKQFVAALATAGANKGFQSKYWDLLVML